MFRRRKKTRLPRDCVKKKKKIRCQEKKIFKRRFLKKKKIIFSKIEEKSA